jgi:uncharacterized protein YecE (DUF72 family)
MSRLGAVRIGTSGWHYKHWRGAFYPEDLPIRKWFEYYCRHFDTVEINNSFYRLPSEAAFDAWREASPAGFCYAVKASRYLTHMKKLKDPQAGIANFLPRAERLGGKLGPVLFQLPPFWEVDVARLDEFLTALPGGHQYTFELRNPTWFVPEVYEILRRHNAAFCIYELAGFHSELQVTADFAYVRLHGPEGKYQGSYHQSVLDTWSARIREWRQELRAIYVYFDNDQAAYAVHNARTLKESLIP